MTRHLQGLVSRPEDCMCGEPQYDRCSDCQTRQPRLLDLFCGAGGSARGYQEAGFYVVGVDAVDQPNYAGDEFRQADVMNVAYHPAHGWILDEGFRIYLGEFDAVHASPPCQAYSDLQKQNKRDYPELIDHIRYVLKRSCRPFVIENVEGAPLIDPVTLCGTMFPGLRVIRHRLFECHGFTVTPPPHGEHPLVFTHDKRKAHYGLLDQDTSFVQVTGGGNATIANKRDAMQIDWMTNAEINEAIPPAYTRHIGEQLLTAIETQEVGV